MNNGKICVSVCAESADEVINQIKRAEDLADVVEIRLDCLKSAELHKTVSRLNSKKTLLLTYRPREQGGKSDVDSETRTAFWKEIETNNPAKCSLWFDYEYDLPKTQINSVSVIIRSFHDFSGVPENLPEIYAKLSENNEIPKIAVRADDITDTIAIWNVLKMAKTDSKEIIPIAMGEAGKWTRILGLAHGALMTYAALDAKSETAPGQVSAGDLRDVYRAGELDENTAIYGILGSNTSISVSPFIHNEAFKFNKLNAVFVPLQTKNLDEFMRRMVKAETREIELNFKGFAVTLPHKQQIIKHLEGIDETAQAIGAVNTVKIIDGKLYGYNTDAEGFISPLRTAYGDLRSAKVAVFGAGGAARACVYALQKDGAEVTLFARNPVTAKNLSDEFQVDLRELPMADDDLKDFDIVVNTTPLGTKGEKQNESIVSAAQIENVKLVYDLIYNPFQTKLMSEADTVHVPKIGGLAMLIAQAIAQQKIWTGLEAPLKEMSRAAVERLK